MENRKLPKVKASQVLRSGQKASEEVWRDFIEEYPQFPEVRKKLQLFC